ncbi:hypothetical protein CC2G_000023 [Coprinopsis cinerea AmutBmut pab1-1]|nr:hypothetical protein CC2G_000023 [Coprinopsis cinerea AmutBmut pab1-1]
MQQPLHPHIECDAFGPQSSLADSSCAACPSTFASTSGTTYSPIYIINYGNMNMGTIYGNTRQNVRTHDHHHEWPEGLGARITHLSSPFPCTQRSAPSTIGGGIATFISAVCRWICDYERRVLRRTWSPYKDDRYMSTSDMHDFAWHSPV